MTSTSRVFQALRDTYEALVGMPPNVPKPPSTDDPEINFLRDFLQGENPSNTHHVYTARPNAYSTRPPRAVLSGGGYELLYRLGDSANPTYLLNLDKPIALLPVETWRTRAFVAARDVGKELIPVSHTAYLRVGTDELPPSLVHRDGFEAVFTVGEGEETKYYLSGYDEQENPPLYFLCRLPHAAATVDEAREALKPESVKTALTGGAAVQRQGDLFFIATGLDDSDVKMATNNVVIGGDDAARKALYGTAHYADSVAHLSGGVMLAKGTVHHWPRLVGQNRGPDHSDLILADGWWMVARNTVPASAGPPARAAFSSGPSVSWLEGIMMSVNLQPHPFTMDEVQDAWSAWFGNLMRQPTTAGEEG